MNFLTIIKKRVIVLFIISLSISLYTGAQIPLSTLIDYNIGDSVQPVPLTNKFSDPDYYIWCGSVMKNKDDRYYMLYSRWPKKDGYYSWCISCEIAVAVSDKPEGPYKHLKVALPARGLKYWDGSATHNPSLTYFKGKYYLYYIGTCSSTPIPFPVNSMHSPEWYCYRNTQRIGVAVANSLDGEWKRFDKPVLDVDKSKDTNFDYHVVTNPSVAAGEHGKLLMVYKQVAKGTDYKGGKVRFGAAFSTSPLGPFIKESKPIFETGSESTAHMIAEDPYLWYKTGYYYAIVRDVIGEFTGNSGGWALLTSPDGKDWKPALHPIVVNNPFSWEGGIKSISQLERPCLLMENGKPVYLFGATRGDKNQTFSYNVAVPLFRK